MIDLKALALRDILPDWIFSDEELAAISDALDLELQSVSEAIEEAVLYPRIMQLPEDVLDEMARAFPGLSVERWELCSLARKREIMIDAYEIAARAGTVWSVRRGIEMLEPDWYSIEEWFDAGMAPYHYHVTLGLVTTGMLAADVRWLREILSTYQPVRAYLEGITAEPHIYGTAFYGVVTKTTVTIQTGNTP